jgi:glycosyltransferase involved in cell wall biosynthesis
MKDILIISHFSFTPNEIGNDRFNYLADILAENNDVEIVTTDFSHNRKTHRTVKNGELKKIKYKFVLLHETGYKKNVTLKRFYSHYVFGGNLKNYLNRRKRPDVIYCAIPSLDAGVVAAKFAKDNKIKFIIDVQDLWPEAFKMVFNVPLISDNLFKPMMKKADFIYAQADSIVGVSQTYVNRALKSNKKCLIGHSVFLGTDLSEFDRFVVDNKIMKPTEEIWIAYVGTLGNSYDITNIIDALAKLKEQGISNLRFIVMGDGPLGEKFKNYAIKRQVPCKFTGRIDYKEMVGVLSSCDIAVNPIMHGAAQSIINKVGDYAAAGLPVISTQECPEYRDLVSYYNIGYNCENGNVSDISKKIEYLINDKEKRIAMGLANRKLAEEKFDRRKSYQEIVNLFN